MPWFDILSHVLVLNIGFAFGTVWYGIIKGRVRDDRAFAPASSVPQTSCDASSPQVRDNSTERIG